MSQNNPKRFFTINDDGNRTYISAMQFTDLNSGRDIVKWINPRAKAMFVPGLPRESGLHMIIILPENETLTATFGVSPNEWVVKTDAGNNFALSDEAFKLAYSEGEEG